MQSEKDFLLNYNLSDYERPSVTADVAAFMIRNEKNPNYRQNSENKLSVLLVKRGGHPYKGCWALPGGFLQQDETIETCALREIKEETNVMPASIMPVGIYSEPGRDPRGWVISSAYVSIISESSVNQIGGDDADDAQWFDVIFDKEDDGLHHLKLCYGETNLHAVLKEGFTRFGKTTFKVIDSGALAFDHARIISEALAALRLNAAKFDTLFDFLPEKFTLSSVQKVQETITGATVLPANFRRKINEYVEETGEYTQGAGHRPAKLYKRKI